jgi:DNA-binding CsgD family transcriptional regulator
MTGQSLIHIEKLRAMTGATRQEAAEALNLCEEYVSLLAKEAGISLLRANRAEIVIEQLKALAASGFTRKEAAAQLGISQSWICTCALRHDIKFIRSGLALEPTVRERQMAALYRSGKTLAEIGAQYGITRERVRQLLAKFFQMDASDGGQAKVAADKRAKFEADRNAKSLKKWGCNWDQYVIIRGLKKPTRAYATQRKNADKRGIGWELNLWQWWCIWQQSGKWAQRGRGQGYMMCRKGDVGPYAVDNVFIATGCENSSNQKRKKSDLPTGVRKNKKCAGYSAARQINGKLIRLGSHPTPELAHAAYLAAGSSQ